MFPTEIWEKILENVDAATLMGLRTVNITWNTIITKHLRESDSWYRQCKKDIPEKYWLLLLENSFHLTTLYRQNNVHSENERCNSKLWMTMYRAWIKWCNVQNYTVQTVSEFKPIPDHRPSERITCSAVLGQLVAVGSTEGYIRIYNLRTNKLVFRVDQYEQVLDLKLCVQGKNYDKIMLVATSIYNKIRVWDITCQKCVIYSFGDVICAGYGYCCTTMSHSLIHVYDATTGDCFPMRLFIKNFNNAKSNTSHHISTSNIMKYVNMIINKYQLCFWTDTGLFCELDLRELNQSIKFSCTPDVTYVGVPKNQNVRHYYLFNPYVVFCITERGYLGISIHKCKWQMYNVFPFLEGLITAIIFYVKVLVIGLDSGDICLYSIENESSLKTIDFKSKKSKRIHISTEPIVSINIMEINGDQRLLVTTKSTVYHIRFDYTNI